VEAKALTPHELFDGKVHYEIPPFQRPYVWTEEDQWQPLWDDIRRVLESTLDPSGDDVDIAVSHFLGAVVLKQLETPSGDPLRRSVIDGQQRLTTLQLLLDAAQHVVGALGNEEDAESLQELVLNDAKRFRGSPKRFKLWPSRVDRAAFEHAMDDELSPPVELIDARISQAHAFFQSAIEEWLTEAADADEKHHWLAALSAVLQQRLQVVAIDLSDSDDDQLIFETLNDRGTPLLQADLIKNYLFQACEELGADVDAWSETYWLDFDEDWWRDQVAQGRLFRSRIDLFLQYWLTMRLRDDVLTDKVFTKFRDHAESFLITRDSAEKFLRELRRDADTFKDFAQLDPSAVVGRFYSRVIEVFELGVFIPLLLWLISENHDVPPIEAARGLQAVESWAIRRTLLRRTMKDANNLVVMILKALDVDLPDQAGKTIVKLLLAQDADSRTWPTDDELRAELPRVKAYGNIKRPRLRAVLSAIELELRTARHEDVSLPTRLEIEHVMPRGWREHWGGDVAQSPELSAARDGLLHTIGNLTLVTQKLNVVLSNRPWTDEAAALVAPSGRDAGLGKRSLLGRYSILLLNKDIIDSNVEGWTEADIRKRADTLIGAAIRVWPRG
jgi:uncharacterized protein DUF262/uncharacterized protein DUF1524